MLTTPDLRTMTGRAELMAQHADTTPRTHYPDGSRIVPPEPVQCVRCLQVSPCQTRRLLGILRDTELDLESTKRKLDAAEERLANYREDAEGLRQEWLDNDDSLPPR